MTAFDYSVLAVVGLSAFLAFLRGMVREAIGLAAWIAALILAFRYAPDLARTITAVDWNPVVLEVIAFVAILLGTLTVGGLLARLLSQLVRSIGLGVADRLLGAGFGCLRGLAIVLLFMLVAGLTSLPRQEWWQNALLAAPLVSVATEFRNWLPRAWADRLDFPRRQPDAGVSGGRSLGATPWEV